jgi:hypothetical protein
MAEVARRPPFPVATGERLVVRAQFLDLLEARAAALLQPDVCHVEVDEGAARLHPYRPQPQIAATLADGSVADW